MHPFRRTAAPLALLLLLVPAGTVRAGLYYSGEEVAQLPAQWRGFLIDQRQLRLVAVKPRPGVTASPPRLRYEKAARELEKLAKEKKLSADQSADLGALYVRLGDARRAVAVLRAAQRAHPRHFRIAANLGTAWQMSGDLDQAAVALREAVRLAPEALRKAEELHLKLIQLRRRERGNSQKLDDLFGVRFINDKGKYEPGKLAEEQGKKLSTEVVAQAQQLALWLPSDARLLWLLAEMAAVYGDLRTAAAIMDGCVTEFALRSPELRRHRQMMREAADALAKRGPTTKPEHEGHAGRLKFRSARPLVDRLAGAELPPIKADGVNAMPWAVVTQTTVDRQYRPTFPKYLRELDGKQVTLRGFMQPLGRDLQVSSFLLIEYPVGCWYCEIPDIVAMILVELPPGKTERFSRELVEVTGRLRLNSTDPEDFLYILGAATVKAAE